jgi:hypothetical protein
MKHFPNNFFIFLNHFFDKKVTRLIFLLLIPCFFLNRDRAISIVLTHCPVSSNTSLVVMFNFKKAHNNNSPVNIIKL